MMDSSYPGENTNMSQRTIEEILREQSKKLMSVPGVVGVAQGLCGAEPCIRVFVVQKTEEIEKKIPTHLGRYPVILEETGEFRALPVKR